MIYWEGSITTSYHFIHTFICEKFRHILLLKRCIYSTSISCQTGWYRSFHYRYIIWRYFYTTFNKWYLKTSNIAWFVRFGNVFYYQDRKSHYRDLQLASKIKVGKLGLIENRSTTPSIRIVCSIRREMYIPRSWIR